MCDKGWLLGSVGLKWNCWWLISVFLGESNFLRRRNEKEERLGDKRNAEKKKKRRKV